MLLSLPSTAGHLLLHQRAGNWAFLAACLWFAGCGSGQVICYLFLVKSRLSLPLADGCNVVLLGLTIVQFLISGVSGGALLAEAAGSAEDCHN